MLTQRDHFKIGVLLACAERGMSLAETHEQVKTALARLREESVEKEAVVKDVLTLGGLLPALVRPAGDVASWGAKTMGTGLLLAPIGIGAGAGYLAGRSRGKLTDEDITEAKKRELISAYTRQAEEAERKQTVGARRRMRRSTPVRSLV